MRNTTPHKKTKMPAPQNLHPISSNFAVRTPQKKVMAILRNLYRLSPFP